MTNWLDDVDEKKRISKNKEQQKFNQKLVIYQPFLNEFNSFIKQRLDELGNRTWGRCIIEFRQPNEYRPFYSWYVYKTGFFGFKDSDIFYLFELKNSHFISYSGSTENSVDQCSIKNSSESEILKVIASAYEHGYISDYVCTG